MPREHPVEIWLVDDDDGHEVWRWPSEAAAGQRRRPGLILLDLATPFETLLRSSSGRAEKRCGREEKPLS